LKIPKYQLKQPAGHLKNLKEPKKNTLKTCKGPKCELKIPAKSQKPTKNLENPKMPTETTCWPS